MLKCFRSLGAEPVTILFFAVINKSAQDTSSTLRDNIAMVGHLIEGAAVANVESLVYLSSADVYGNRPAIPITEETQINPDTWYGLAKYCGERMLQFATPVTVLRIPGVYGNFPRDKSVIGRMVAAVRDGNPIPITGEGKCLRDYVHVLDLCRVIDAVIPLRGRQVINVGTGHSHNVADIAQMVGRVLKKPARIERQAADPAREFDLVFDNRRLSELVPGFQFTNLEEGIRSYG